MHLERGKKDNGTSTLICASEIWTISENETIMKDYVRYNEKLFDPRWKEMSKRILDRDNHRCVICGRSEGKLQVHHKRYHFIKQLQCHVDPWDYDDKYLITLCESCHRRGHARYKVPVKYI